MTVQTYTGSCHCGAIAFEADLDLAEGSNRCDCSYCAKARAWFIFAQGADRFRLVRADGASEYRWTPPGADAPHLTYTFCSRCGIRAFARGHVDALGGTFHAVHVPTLDLTLEERVSLPVRYRNGRENRFEDAPIHPEAL